MTLDNERLLIKAGFTEQEARELLERIERGEHQPTPNHILRLKAAGATWALPR